MVYIPLSDLASRFRSAIKERHKSWQGFYFTKCYAYRIRLVSLSCGRSCIALQGRYKNGTWGTVLRSYPLVHASAVAHSIVLVCQLEDVLDD